MGGWQIAMIVLFSLDLLTGAYLHGKPKKDNHNFLVTLISSGILFLVLLNGGFFS